MQHFHNVPIDLVVSFPDDRGGRRPIDLHGEVCLNVVESRPVIDRGHDGRQIDGEARRCW